MQGINRPRLLKLARRAALLLAANGLAASCAWGLPTFAEVKKDFKPSDVQVLDRHGELLHSLRNDRSVRRGQWVALADISPALRNAMVLSEDKRFYEHSGVDWQAASAAAWANLWNTRTRGASTITMQLAGLLDDDYRRAGSGRSLVQKLGQTLAAQSLERGWRKDQILEAYLNLVPLRGELVGVDALSHTLFGKAPHGLDEREAAVTAALVRAPNAKPDMVARRACGVLQDMARANPTAVNCQALDMFTAAALQRRDFDASTGIAPHVAQRLVSVRAEQTVLSRVEGVEAQGKPAKLPVATIAPSSIRTTLRAPLQRFAQQTLQTQLRELRGRHVEDAALVVLDNASGQVLAWVGSSGALSSAADVDAVTALRQPGSTLKPFLYGEAIAERRLTAASLLEDSPNQIATASGLYIPQNYDRQFKGWVSVRTALGASLNVPAVRTLEMVSPNAFHRQLRALGLPLRESGDYFGYSLALGSAEVSLLDLANAYRALANNGRYSRVAPLALAGNGKPTPASPASQALDARAAYIVSDILSDGNARARTFGTDSVLATRFWTAVKTGTSKDMRDNWAVGYSRRYTVGVWVGNASGAAMWDVSGTSGAAPIWAAVMNFLHRSEPSKAPAPPPGLEQHAMRFAQQQEANRSEWFLRGTGQDVIASTTTPPTKARGRAAEPAPARITSPVSGTIVALDPDIPPTHQRLRFTQEGTAGRWLMDGKEFGRGAQVAWLPWPGKHQVQLLNNQGQVVDEVRIEVRGAGVLKARYTPR